MVYTTNMGTLPRNRLLDAVVKTLLCFVVVHLTVVLIAALKNGSFSALNVFTILDLDRLWPSLGSGFDNQLLSVFAGILLFAFVFRFLTKRSPPGSTEE